VTVTLAPSPVQSPVASAVKRQSTRVADSSLRSSATFCASASPEAKRATASVDAAAARIVARACDVNVLEWIVGTMALAALPVYANTYHARRRQRILDAARSGRRGNVCGGPSSKLTLGSAARNNRTG